MSSTRLGDERRLAVLRLGVLGVLGALGAGCPGQGGTDPADGSMSDLGAIAWRAGRTIRDRSGAGGAALDGGAADASSGGASAPIPTENLQPGDPSWLLSQPSRAAFRDVEGYASVTSAAAGESFTVHLHTAVATTVQLLLYRIGHYGGVGARRVADLGSFAAAPQPLPAPDPDTHLIECDWPAAAVITVDAGWTSGFYLLKLRAGTGYEAFIPIVVRDQRPADVVFVASVTTWQAYNFWGGWSLYGHPTGTATYASQPPVAQRVSFDRPYGVVLAGDSYFDTAGAAKLLLWDVYTVRWLEERGYDVTYATDVDVHLRPTLQGRRIAIVGAHDEYWSNAMRAAFDGARDAGVSLAFLGANEAYWKIRLEASSAGVPARIVTCYRDAPGDPFAFTSESSSVLWRNAGQAEQALVGQMYDKSTGNIPQVALRVARPGHWVFAGTGLTAGSVLPGLVGYEFDDVQPAYPIPPGLEVLAASPTPFGACAHLSLYFASSGAQVFSAGTIGWAWGLGKPGFADPRVGTITANVLDNMLHHTHGPTPSAQGIPPCP